MWVRIKGILYNLSLVKSIDFNNRQHSIQLFFTSVIPNQYGPGYKNDSAYISFDEAEDALLAYKHIIKTIDIPQLQDSGFHNKNL
tara:strand:+ start:67 stop:321 length:255 start_codon:yes stop_codon:yes gene_type:complete